MGVSEVVESEVLSVLELELDARRGVGRVEADALESVGLDGEFLFAGEIGADGDGGFRRAVVADVEAEENARGGEAELGRLGFGIFEDEVEGAEFPGGHADLPLRVGPVDYAGRILAVEDGARRLMGVVEGYVAWRDCSAVALDINVPR